MIYIFLEDFHDTIAPSSVKTYPLANFKSLVSDNQLAASLYPFSTVR